MLCIEFLEHISNLTNNLKTEIAGTWDYKENGYISCSGIKLKKIENLNIFNKEEKENIIPFCLQIKIKEKDLETIPDFFIGNEIFKVNSKEKLIHINDIDKMIGLMDIQISFELDGLLSIEFADSKRMEYSIWLFIKGIYFWYKNNNKQIFKINSNNYKKSLPFFIENYITKEYDITDGFWQLIT